MASVRTTSLVPEVEYPDSDGRLVGETPQHRDNLLYKVYELQQWYANDEDVYVSGNMFVYYVPGNKLFHVSPDVFVVKGVPKRPERRRYLVWEEGKAPDAVIEFTSESTREEDLEEKFDIYEKKLKVKEYFLFDPFEEYLDPSLQGYRLRGGKYVKIHPVKGRLPSKVLDLHLERDDWELRFYNPKTGLWLPTPPEQGEALKQTQAEVERLRREIERLKKRGNGA